MKPFGLIFLILITFSAKAQLAIINDPDGFVNVREGQGTNTPIVGKIYDGQPFMVFTEESKGKWLEVTLEDKGRIDFSKRKSKYTVGNDGPLNGYIFFDRTVLIQNLPHIDKGFKNRQLTKNKIAIKNDSILFSVTINPFNSTRHSVHSKVGFAYKIDGVEPKGVDGELPHIEISNVNLAINGEQIEIPLDAYKDLYEPAIKNLNIYFDKKGTMYIEMPGSDGAGGYDVVWVIKNRKLVQRYFDNSDA